MALRLSVGLSVVALVVLAGLQYHWIGEIAVAERLRLERSVEESSARVAEDFSGELRNLAGIIPRYAPPPIDSASIAVRYHNWALSTGYPDLAKSIYLVRSPEEVLHLAPSMQDFEPAPWPAFFPTAVEFLEGRGFGTVDSGRDLMVLPLNRRFGGRGGWPPGGDGDTGARGQAGGPRDAARARDGDPNDGWVVFELDHDVIVDRILPRLVSRRFMDYEGRDYRVTVIASRASGGRRTIFTSGDTWTEKDLETPDYALDMFAPPLQSIRRGAGATVLSAGQRSGRGERGGRLADARGPMVTLAGQNWRLLVKHRAGSVATAVMEFRRRNLAISFGILVVLGVSAVSIVVSGSRARRLGNLQMEFAAGVSHELRTPLAVIQSAAHNLGSGVVQDREGIEEYAGIVKGEARRLTDMVEQVMAYTETRSGRKRYDLGPVDVRDVVEAATKNMSTALRDGNASVHKDIQDDLPPVWADAPALIRCLQNLLSNAVKYGRKDNSAHIAIEARHRPDSGRIELSVTDNGPGVPERDVKHLFEAFYRGSNASTNTPGNGLGLHLVDRIMEAQGGSVSHERSAEGGARFTLTLQVAANPT